MRRYKAEYDPQLEEIYKSIGNISTQPNLQESLNTNSKQ